MLPVPAIDLRIRPATLGDVPDLDRLQRPVTRQVGFFPTKQFEGYVRMNAVLVAVSGGAIVGYCIAKDRYSGRDDLGVVFQLNVDPTVRRKRVGAALMKATLERAAYGCRLFCCWCAQDIEAGEFWKSVGFVPVAVRRGSERKRRTHVLWQRRVNAGDDTPYWYPYETKNGSIRESRLCFPIPPGTPWREAATMELPPEARPPGGYSLEDKSRKPRRREIVEKKAEVPKMRVWVGGRWKLVDRPAPAGRLEAVTPVPVVVEETLPAVVEKKEPKVREIAPHEAAASAFCRELRDRWAERAAEEPALLTASAGRYEVGRALQGTASAALPAREPRRLAA